MVLPRRVRHADRHPPQTIGDTLKDSPACHLAWNLEWFVDNDPTPERASPIDRDTILTDVTTSSLTATAGSAARLYREIAAETWGTRQAPSPVLTGVVNVAGDHAVRGQSELSNRITHRSEYLGGGHFVSPQAPELLVTDIREFVRTLRRGS